MDNNWTNLNTETVTKKTPYKLYQTMTISKKFLKQTLQNNPETRTECDKWHHSKGNVPAMK